MRIRVMRGQVVVREEGARTGAIWTPDPRMRDVHTHTGRVIALGAPARVDGVGAEVPHGFEVGDLVQFHFTSHQEAATRRWIDGEPATWIPQENVDGVWE